MRKTKLTLSAIHALSDKQLNALVEADADRPVEERSTMLAEEWLNRNDFEFTVIPFDEIDG